MSEKIPEEVNVQTTVKRATYAELCKQTALLGMTIKEALLNAIVDWLEKDKPILEKGKPIEVFSNKTGTGSSKSVYVKGEKSHE
jgi:hypothetical protein